MLAIDGRTRIASSGRPTRGSRVDIRVAPRPTAHARCTRTRGAKLVACAAEGGSESTREVRSTWLGLGLGLGLGLRARARA